MKFVLGVPKTQEKVHHNLILDDDAHTGVGNNHWIGFSGNDVIFIQFTEPTSHEWKFTADGHIYFRYRHDWIHWDAWEQKI